MNSTITNRIIENLDIDEEGVVITITAKTATSLSYMVDNTELGILKGLTKEDLEPLDVGAKFKVQLEDGEQKTHAIATVKKGANTRGRAGCAHNPLAKDAF